MHNEWKAKELAKLRMQRKRSGDICYAEVTDHVTQNVTPISSSSSSSSKTIYADCVYLTTDEYQKLISKYGQFLTDKAIWKLSNYIQTKQKDPYKSHYHALIGWPMDWAKEKYEKKQEQSSPYETCGRCGAEYRRGETAIINGVDCCPKCPEVRANDGKNYHDLIKNIGRQIV